MNLDSKDKILLVMKYLGDDFWSLPVYQDQFGYLWKDIELGESTEPSLYSVTNNEIDGEPDKPIKKKFILQTRKEFVSREKRFQYQMLDRLRCDCEYYLGFGCSNPGVLREKDEKKHIEAMKSIWHSFSEEEKPKWITWEEIMEYEKNMCEPAI